MILKLINDRTSYPSGAPYTDERTGMKFDPYRIGLREAIKAVITHRSKNPTFYPQTELHWFDKKYVEQQIFKAGHAVRPDVFAVEGAEYQPPTMQYDEPLIHPAVLLLLLKKPG